MVGKKGGTVGNYVTLQRGKTYNGMLVGAPGPVLLGLGSIEPGGGFREGHYKTYGGECPENLMLYPGDIYVSLKGATKDGSMIGSVARVPPTVECGRLTQDTVKLEFRDASPVLKQHIYWVLRTPQYRDYCAGRATGSAQVGLSREDFLAYPIPPVTAVTKKLGDVLEATEAKVELNRRMNETLEAMARAIFKSWFVDFDPVRAKAEGCDSRLPKSAADLFPDCFEDSELGTIPKGWAIGTLGAAATINARSIKRGYRHQVIRYVEISSVTVGKLEATTEYDVGAAPSRAQRLVAHGDTIWSCVRPNRKSFLFVHEPEDNLVVSTGFAVLTPKFVPPCYLYAWVTTDDFVEYLSYSADGSAYPAVRPERFAAARMLVPPKPILDQFEVIVESLRDRIAANERESLALAALRDVLLPKLLSGELSLSEARTSMKEAL
jgi:type I restriction enzyme, S subunit